MSRPIQIGDRVRWHSWGEGAAPQGVLILEVNTLKNMIVTDHGRWNINEGISPNAWILVSPARIIPNTQLKEGGNL